MTIRRGYFYAFSVSTLAVAVACGGHVDATEAPETFVDLDNGCGRSPTVDALALQPRVLAELDPSAPAYIASALANDGDKLFVLADGVRPELSALLSIAKSGAAAVKLADAPYATRVAAQGEYAYFTNANEGGLFRVRKDGAAAPARFAPEGSSRWQTATPLDLTASGGAIYFTYLDGKASALSKIDGATGSVVWTASIDGVVRDVAVNEGVLWFVRATNELVRASVSEDGVLTTTSMTRSAEGIGGVAIANGVTFYATGSSIRALGTAAESVVVADGQDHPSRLFVDGTYVYWVNAGHLEGACGLSAYPGASVPCRTVGAGLMRAPKSGGAVVNFGASEGGESFVRDATEDACSFYWTSNGRVLSRAK